MRFFRFKPGEHVLVADEASSVSGSDALFDGFYKPALVIETAGEHVGGELLRRAAATLSDAGELVFEFRGKPDFHMASVAWVIERVLRARADMGCERLSRHSEFNGSA